MPPRHHVITRVDADIATRRPGDAEILLLGTEIGLGSRSIGDLAAGAANQGSTTATIPTDTAPDSYYLIDTCHDIVQSQL